MRQIGCAILLLTCFGCGPSREVQYLQAAEEVKAEEARLAELKNKAAAKQRELEAFRNDIKKTKDDIKRVTFEGDQRLIELNLPKEQFDAAVAESTARLLNIWESLDKVEQEKIGTYIAARDEAKKLVLDQQEVVDRAIARRDAFSMTTAK